jgi:dipeptidyl aminopeptidase/acylaminoacyl peptidase
MLYGFLGNRAEWPIAGTTEGPYTRAARIWAENGIASLRIDYRGSGESGGVFSDATLSTETADGIAAVGFLKADPRVDADRLGILGWSLGGPVATAVATQSAADALVLWNGVTDPLATFTGLFGAETMAADPAGAPLDVVMPWGQPIAVGRPLIGELRAADPVAEIARYSGPLFVAQGNLDVVVPPEGAPRLVAAHAGPEEIWVRDMDHMFNMEQGPEVTDELIAASGTFLANHLR